MKYDKIIKRTNKVEDELKKIKEECEIVKKQNEKLSTALDGVMHEVRRFSSELSTYAESLGKLITSTNQEGQIKELSNTIFYTSGMLASRLAFTDIELNPEAIRLQLKVRTSIYRKFDKARHILINRARSKQVQIIFKGNSNSEFDAIEAFELVPFVILDNAIKYSPANREVTVTFTEQQRELEVTIQSCGPTVKSSELLSIFEKGFRGHNSSAATAGDGLGLYLAKTLCTLTSIGISAKSNQQPEFKFGGIDYSTFEITLLRKFG